ncbi:MAG TPA: hypothetical protein VJ225_04670 [Nitrososphaeraceae archaeon]|nr:hypothetical protein [Nitrososphaeraceae archaeon]
MKSDLSKINKGDIDAWSQSVKKVVTEINNEKSLYEKKLDCTVNVDAVKQKYQC